MAPNKAQAAESGPIDKTEETTHSVSRWSIHCAALGLIRVICWLRHTFVSAPMFIHAKLLT